MPTILLVQRSALEDGSSLSGLSLADALQDAGWSTHVAFGHEGPIIGDYQARGHATYHIPHNNWLRRKQPHQFLRDVWIESKGADQFERAFEAIQPDVVYINSLVSLSAVVAARRVRLPYIWHLREMFGDAGGEMIAPGPLLPVLRVAIRRLCSRVIATSQVAAENVLGQCDCKNVSIVPNAVNPKFFEDRRSKSDARNALGLDGRPHIIGVAGSLRPVKGHEFFLRSMSRELEWNGELQVLLAGSTDGQHARYVRSEVARLGLVRQVQFLGSVKDMSAFYRACDVICVPSRSESFGRVIVEAFAAGTPVVATDVGGISSIVHHRSNGLLVKYGDEADLAEAVGILLRDRSLGLQLASNARADAEMKYHQRIIARQLVEIVENVRFN